MSTSNMDDVSPPYHHEDLYYEDGNICLIAQNTTVFRLFKGQLAKHSAVFSDMLALGSTPTDSRETWEGAPCVHLDDDPDDLARLFDYLWNPRLRPATIDEIVSLLKTSHKYLIESIRTWCVARLEEILPVTADKILVAINYYNSNPDLAVSIVEVGRECDLPQFLPFAYYWLCCNSEEIPTSSLTHFEYTDMRRLFLARDTFRSLWSMYLVDALQLEDGRRPPAWAQCHIVSARGMEGSEACRISGSPLRSHDTNSEGEQDPLSFWLQDIDRTCGPCTTCVVNHKHLRRIYASRLVNALPRIFRLNGLEPLYTEELLNLRIFDTN